MQFEEIIKRGPFSIYFPDKKALDQNEEWCEVEIDGKRKRVRFHDYDEVFQVPGLYETIFYRTLACVSPTEVATLLKTVFLEQEVDPLSVRALDFGAGNGMGGEALHSIGIKRIVGADILPEAKMACQRDRIWVYDDYFVEDFSEISEKTMGTIKDMRLNTLITIAALGFGDIPTRAFFNAFNLIDEQGWVAFNIKEDFLSGDDRSGFAGLINRMYEQGIMRCEMFKRYRHRLNVNGKPLYYVGLVGKKLKHIPESLLEDVEEKI